MQDLNARMFNKKNLTKIRLLVKHDYIIQIITFVALLCLRGTALVASIAVRVRIAGTVRGLVVRTMVSVGPIAVRIRVAVPWFRKVWKGEPTSK